MNQPASTTSNDMEHVAEHALELMAATADATDEKVKNARQRLAYALERSKELYGRVRAKAVEGAKAVDETVHEHPYQAIAIGIGTGALIGYLLGRRGSRHND